MDLHFQAARGLGGRFTPPADKSITHRALMLAAVAEGRSRIVNPLDTGDCRSTRRCLQALGVEIDGESRSLQVRGRGLRNFREPADVLDAGNSGTTARLLTGLLAAQDLFAVLSGDRSLRERPMLRVIEPLRRMGARILGRGRGRNLPLVFPADGGRLGGAEHRLQVASAQVKSALLLAALRAEGAVRVGGAIDSRDHTERLFDFLELPLRRDNGWLLMDPVRRIPAFQLTVPGDLSSAAFFIAASVLCGRELLVEGCGLNPTRLGFLEILRRMGAGIEVVESSIHAGEKVGTLRVQAGEIRAVEVGPEQIPACIDEVPLLALLGLFAEGVTRIRGAAELRHKESDRLSAVSRLASAAGGRIRLSEDGFTVEGPQSLKSGIVDAQGDHRIAMAAAVLGSAVCGGMRVQGFEAAAVSFPDFLAVFRQLGGEVT